MKLRQLLTEIRQDFRALVADSKKTRKGLFYLSYLVLSVSLVDYLVSQFVPRIPVPSVDKWVGESLNTNAVGAAITWIVNTAEKTPGVQYDFMYEGVTHSLFMLILALSLLGLLLCWIPILFRHLNNMDRLRKSEKNAAPAL
jgi:hypothetical protein